MIRTKNTRRLRFDRPNAKPKQPESLLEIDVRRLVFWSLLGGVVIISIKYLVDMMF